MVALFQGCVRPEVEWVRRECPELGIALGKQEGSDHEVVSLVGWRSLTTPEDSSRATSMVVPHLRIWQQRCSVVCSASRRHVEAAQPRMEPSILDCSLAVFRMDSESTLASPSVEG